MISSGLRAIQSSVPVPPVYPCALSIEHSPSVNFTVWPDESVAISKVDGLLEQLGPLFSLPFVAGLRMRSFVVAPLLLLQFRLLQPLLLQRLSLDLLLLLPLIVPFVLLLLYPFHFHSLDRNFKLSR